MASSISVSVKTPTLRERKKIGRALTSNCEMFVSHSRQHEAVTPEREHATSLKTPLMSGRVKLSDGEGFQKRAIKLLWMGQSERSGN
jgi:hypothetical protein